MICIDAGFVFGMLCYKTVEYVVPTCRNRFVLCSLHTFYGYCYWILYTPNDYIMLYCSRGTLHYPQKKSYTKSVTMFHVLSKAFFIIFTYFEFC